MEVGRHCFTLYLILVCNLANNELGIAINFQGLYFHLFCVVESYDQRLVLSFIVGGFEPKLEGTMHLMSFRAD